MYQIHTYLEKKLSLLREPCSVPANLAPVPKNFDGIPKTDARILENIWRILRSV